MRGWIGVDLDGTLATYDRWRGVAHIGAPVPLMVERVKRWLAEGKHVRIFTARISDLEGEVARHYIDAWCETHIGRKLPITNIKDFGMVEFGMIAPCRSRRIRVIVWTGILSRLAFQRRKHSGCFNKKRAANFKNLPFGR